LIIAAGPLVTACLAAGAYALYRVDLPYSPLGAVADHLVNVALIVNVVGLVINLLPIRSLDGGQLLRAARAGRRTSRYG
jgi:Zn-dependent protease